MPTLTVIVEQVLARVPGGSGRHAAQLTSALVAGAPDGWRVRLVTAWHRDVSAARSPGADGPVRLPAGARALAVLWQYGLPPWPHGDSVHAMTPLAPRRNGYSTGFGRRTAGGRRGTPLVATVQDAIPWTHPETLTPRGVAWHRAMITRLAREADAIVVPTAATRAALAERFPAAADRLQLIPLGVTPLAVPLDAIERRSRLGLPADTPYVLFIGTVEPRKGLDVLLPAMNRHEAGGTDLVLVGARGWGEQDAAALASAAGLDAARLHLLGRVDDADLGAVLAGAAALALPSRAEGFGLPLVEAMAAGVPTVHTDIEVLREVGGGAGIAVPVGNAEALAEALGRVLADPALADRMRVAGRAVAAGYSWAAAARQTWELHLGLAGG